MGRPKNSKRRLRHNVTGSIGRQRRKEASYQVLEPRKLLAGMAGQTSLDPVGPSTLQMGLGNVLDVSDDFAVASASGYGYFHNGNRDPKHRANDNFVVLLQRDDNGTAIGSDDIWNEFATIEAPEEGMLYWGNETSIDGNNLAISNGIGGVYTYVFDGTQWNFDQHILSPELEGVDVSFGSQVDISGDTMVVVDSGYVTAAGSSYKGRFYSYQLEDGQWTLDQTFDNLELPAFTGYAIISGELQVEGDVFVSGNLVYNRDASGQWVRDEGLSWYAGGGQRTALSSTGELARQSTTSGQFAISTYEFAAGTWNATSTLEYRPTIDGIQEFRFDGDTIFAAGYKYDYYGYESTQTNIIFQRDATGNWTPQDVTGQVEEIGDLRRDFEMVLDNGSLIIGNRDQENGAVASGGVSIYSIDDVGGVLTTTELLDDYAPTPVDVAGANSMDQYGVDVAIGDGFMIVKSTRRYRDGGAISIFSIDEGTDGATYNHVTDFIPNATLLSSIEAEGNRIYVGNTSADAIEVYEFDGSSVIRLADIPIADLGVVYDLKADGNRLAVGMRIDPYDAVDGNRIMVFEETATGWVEDGTIFTLENRAPRSVDIAGDTLVTYDSLGSVYDRDATGWNFKQSFSATGISSIDLGGPDRIIVTELNDGASYYERENDQFVLKQSFADPGPIPRYDFAKIDGDEMVVFVQGSQNFTGVIYRYLSMVSYDFNPDSGQWENRTVDSLVTDSRSYFYNYTMTLDFEDGHGVYGYYPNQLVEAFSIGGSPATIDDAFAALTEDEVSTSGTMTITDPDPGENRFVAETIDGTYGSLTIDDSGAWTYTPGAAAQTLNDGDLENDVFTVSSVDGSATGTLTVTVEGTNDAAIIGGTLTGSTDEDSTAILTGTATVSDIDDGESLFTAETISKFYGTLVINQNGTWTMETTPQADRLITGESYVERFNVTTVDGTRGFLEFTIEGRDDTPVFSGLSHIIYEDTNPTYELRVIASDLDQNQSGVIGKTEVGMYGTIEIQQGIGQAVYTADQASIQFLRENESVVETFTVTSLDGTEATLAIEIRGRNDQAVFGGDQDVTIDEDTVSTSGVITITDLEPGEDSFVANTVDHYFGTFSIAEDGSWTYDVNNNVLQGLAAGEMATDRFSFFSFDGTRGFVDITITGSNDEAVIGGTLTGTTDEDSTESVSGTATVYDVDGAESFIAETISGDYGSLTISEDGSWSFAVDNAAAQAIPAGVSETSDFAISASDGTVATVSITITGNNDAATIAGTTTGELTEDATTSATGTLAVDDVDAGEAFVQSQADVAGLYGTFSVDANGNWTFILDSAAVDYLDTGESVTDSFVVDSLDGTSAVTIVVTINGLTDDPTEVIPDIIEDVEDLVDTGDLTNGQSNPIKNHLNNALKDINKGKINKAISKLEDAQDLIQELLDNGELTAADANPLLAAIDSVLASLTN